MTITTMSLSRVLVAFASLLTPFAVAFADAQVRDAQTGPPRDGARAAPAGTATLGGTVVNEDAAGRPIRRALITLAGAGLAGTVQVVTDDAGRFVFAQLPAGRYTLTADKPGHVRTYYGSKRFGRGPAMPIALADGQRVVELSIRLLRGAVVEGTVVDEHGTPLSSAQVMILQPTFVNGVRKLTAVPNVTPWATTDDRGRYRIYGLAPGEYTVRAGGSPLPGGARLTTAADVEGATRELQSAARGAIDGSRVESPQVSRTGSYFPGVPDPAQAELFTLGPAEERTGVDIQSVLVRSSRLEGLSIGPGGQPLTNVLVGIANLGSGSLFSSPGIIRPRPDGRFALASILPGRYAFFGRGTDADTNPTPDIPLPLWTWTEFTIGEQDVSDVVMPFAPGVSVSGRLTFQGSQPVPEVAKLRVSLTAVPAIPGTMLNLPAVTPQPNGTFEITGVPPGRYRLSVAGAGAWSLRAAIVNGADMLDTPLEVPPGQNVGDVAVTLTDRAAEVSGTLFDQLGRPAPEYGVVMFSTDRQHWATSPRRQTGVVKLASDGTFVVRGLPPGEYYLAAVTDPDPSQLADPAVLEQLAGASLKLVLPEGEKKVQDLKLAASPQIF